MSEVGGPCQRSANIAQACIDPHGARWQPYIMHGVHWNPSQGLVRRTPTIPGGVSLIRGEQTSLSTQHTLTVGRCAVAPDARQDWLLVLGNWGLRYIVDGLPQSPGTHVLTISHAVLALAACSMTANRQTASAGCMYRCTLCGISACWGYTLLLRPCSLLKLESQAAQSDPFPRPRGAIFVGRGSCCLQWRT
jgi:hypothetical protein